MKILLVAPKNPPSFWTYDTILPTLGKRCLCPNLALPTLAALTPAGHRLMLCDENVQPIDFDVKADIVGITGYMVHRPRILEIIEAFRRRGRFVAVGGPFASLCPEALAGHCDAIFIGEAEGTWPTFLRDLEAGHPKTEYRASGFPELTCSPLPRFDLLRRDRYWMMPLQVSRGCPFRCEFCDVIILYGRRPRTKPIERVMQEIAACHRLGVRRIFVVDDNFIGNRSHAKRLLREIVAWQCEHGQPLEFNTEVSVNVARDEELLELLRAARFTTLFVGIESPRQSSLQEAGKIQNTRNDLVESVRKIQRFGIQVQAGMIVGFDHDDPAVFGEQLEFLRKARIPVAMAGMLQALPKTPLHARVAEQGRLLTESSGDPFLFSNVVPERMSLEELYRGYGELLQALYDFRSFRERVLAFLAERGQPLRRKRWVERGELRLLVRILRDTLVRVEPRRAWFTLSLLGRTLLRRPSAIRDAIAFALVHKGLADYVRSVIEPLGRVHSALGAQATRLLGDGRDASETASS